MVRDAPRDRKSGIRAAGDGTITDLLSQPIQGHMGVTPEVAFFLGQGPKKADGGIASVSEIIERIDPEPLVFTTRESEASKRWRRSGAEVRIFPFDGYLAEKGVGKIQRLIRSNVKTFKLIRNAGPSVVHTNDRVAFRGCGLGARLAGVPVVNNVRDTQPRMTGRRRVKWLLEFLLSTRVVTLTQSMCSRWVETLQINSLPSPLCSSLKQKLSYIYSIVDQCRFNPLTEKSKEEIQRERGVTGSPLLVYMASFHP